MKQKDLVVGMEYFSNANRSWEDSSWGARRVRIVDTGVKRWHKKADDTWGNSSNRFTTHGVLVEELHTETGDVLRTGAVSLGSIRGLWGPVNTMLTERFAERAASAKAQCERQKAQQDKVGTVVAFMKQAFGLKTGVRGDSYDQKIIIDADLLMAMAAELEKQGWKYEVSK